MCSPLQPWHRLWWYSSTKHCRLSDSSITFERAANKEGRHQYMAKTFMLQTDCRVINKIYCKGALTPDPPLWSPVHFLICCHLTRRGGPSNKNQRLLFMVVNGSVLSQHPWCQSCRRFPNLRWAKRLAKWRAYV